MPISNSFSHSFIHFLMAQQLHRVNRTSPTKWDSKVIVITTATLS